MINFKKLAFLCVQRYRIEKHEFWHFWADNQNRTVTSVPQRTMEAPSYFDDGIIKRFGPSKHSETNTYEVPIQGWNSDCISNCGPDGICNYYICYKKIREPNENAPLTTAILLQGGEPFTAVGVFYLESYLTAVVWSGEVKGEETIR